MFLMTYNAIFWALTQVGRNYSNYLFYFFGMFYNLWKTSNKVDIFYLFFQWKGSKTHIFGYMETFLNELMMKWKKRIKKLSLSEISEKCSFLNSDTLIFWHWYRSKPKHEWNSLKFWIEITISKFSNQSVLKHMKSVKMLKLKTW